VLCRVSHFTKRARVPPPVDEGPFLDSQVRGQSVDSSCNTGQRFAGRKSAETAIRRVGAKITLLTRGAATPPVYLIVFQQGNVRDVFFPGKLHHGFSSAITHSSPTPFSFLCLAVTVGISLVPARPCASLRRARSNQHAFLDCH
jgi:hypothetical protein